MPARWRLSPVSREPLVALIAGGSSRRVGVGNTAAKRVASSPTRRESGMRAPAVNAVYQIRCTTNGRSYVGVSINVNVRWPGHRSLLKRGMHSCSLLQADWNTYGEAAFELLILETLPDGEHQQHNIREKAWIKKIEPAYNFSRRRGDPEPAGLLVRSLATCLTARQFEFVKQECARLEIPASVFLRSLVEDALRKGICRVP